jgi:hypothetical protein
MSALPEPHDDGNENNPLPITSEIIGKINGTKSSGINSDQVRELKRLINGHTGGILVETVDGRVVAMHPIKITTYNK